MSIVRWNPWREFDDFFPRLSAPSESLSTSEWLPAVDISETDTAYHIDVEIPAIAREDVNVAVKDGVLTVTGERNVEKRDGWQATPRGAAVRQIQPQLPPAGERG